MSYLSRLSESIQEDVHEVAKGVRDLQSRAVTRERRELVAWLSPLNFWSKQSDVLSGRLEQTGEWFLESDEFKDWFKGTQKTLWCRGIRMTLTPTSLFCSYRVLIGC